MYPIPSRCTILVLFVEYDVLATDCAGSTPNPKGQTHVPKIMCCFLEHSPASGIQLPEHDLNPTAIELVRRPVRLNWTIEWDRPLEAPLRGETQIKMDLQMR
jgi:hypothetical protein